MEWAAAKSEKPGSNEDRRDQQNHFVSEAINQRSRRQGCGTHSDKKQQEQITLLGKVHAQAQAHGRHSEQGAQKSEDNSEDKHAGASGSKELRSRHLEMKGDCSLPSFGGKEIERRAEVDGS